MTNFLDDDVIKQVRDVFDAQLKQPVEVLFFGRQDVCDYCEDTQQLIEEVTAISDKLRLSIYDLEKDAALARQYHVDKAPGLVLTGRDGDQLTDYGIRFSGLPSGYEFTSLINDLLLVSGRDSGLNQQTRDFLKNLKEPIHLQVFVTPT